MGGRSLFRRFSAYFRVAPLTIVFLFFVIGPRMSSVSALIASQYSHIQYPFATASGIVLLVVLLLFVGALMRLVDVYKQL